MFVSREKKAMARGGSLRFSLYGGWLFFVILFLRSASSLYAETLTLNLGEGAFSTRILSLIALLTVLSLAPSILVMVTSFTRIVVVMSFLRHAMGMGQSPPTSVLMSLSLFLTFFTMQPTLERVYNEGLKPYFEESISEEQAIERVSEPIRAFMLKHVGRKELGVFKDLAKIETIETPEETPFRILVPTFMITELKRAFEIGFLLFIPFLIIDLVVASVVMSMGMMMLPPMMLSLPFKIIFFVLADGWSMLAGSLVRSYH